LLLMGKHMSKSAMPTNSKIKNTLAPRAGSLKNSA
jgi:hypothetical protein